MALASALLLLSACRPVPLLEGGPWRIEGSDALGAIQVEPAGWGSHRTRVRLAHAGMLTDGWVEAKVEAEPDGLTWLRFPARTPLGEAWVSMRLQGRQAMLPMGAREGEHELTMSLLPHAVDEARWSEAERLARQQLEARAAAWAAGAFLLQEADGAVVGELRLRPDEPAFLAVFDRLWWTEGVVLSDRLDEGPEIILTFPVEPSLKGEDGQLRLNVPLMAAVVPADSRPTDFDRHLRLTPGALDEAARQVARQQARSAADQAEREALVALGRRLAVRSPGEDGRCRPWKEIDPQLEDLLVGYEVQLEADESGRCRAIFQPTIPQHRRRLSLRVSANGVEDELAGHQP